MRQRPIHETTRIHTNLFNYRLPSLGKKHLNLEKRVDNMRADNSPIYRANGIHAFRIDWN